jgi:hypothetical protein
MLNKTLIFGIIVILIGIAVFPSMNANVTKAWVDEDTEYWGLLIAVGVYAGHPDQNRPSMLREVENLHDMLLVSEHWNEDHIKVIKGENATMWNIFKGLRWLDKMDDKNDFSLVYITTHGARLSKDKWPWDEEDGRDEFLVSYRGFQFPWANIRDDILNLMLSLLSAKGVCVVVDSCYSGGFNDPPYFPNFMRNKRGNNQISASEWMQELGEDLQGKGRVVLMSCREDELSYGSIFSKLLIESLRGYADTNEDKIVTAEEAYEYVKENMPGSKMHPTIFDNYPGELPLTEVEFPPSVPISPIGQIIGETNTTYNYSTVSTDPEGHRIKYGWDCDSDNVVDEWSDFLDSGTWDNISLSWSIEGTYNIKVKAVDELGVESEWSNNTVVSMCSDHIPDQRQTELRGGIFLGMWVAQSFVPSLNSLSKVELGICSWGSGDPPPVHLYIRDNLSGDNLAEISRSIPPLGYSKTAWSKFDFQDLEVIPGNTYYIVCEKIDPGWGYSWKGSGSDDSYPSGSFFVSNDGNSWHTELNDGSFVTWGKI